jgi:hypothetical protein
MNKINDIGIITLAYGSSKYIEMGKALGRSLQLHSPDISRAIVTDRLEDEEIVALFDHIIPLRREYGSNVRQKLYLDQYSPYQKTLFIDSDSLVVRNLRFAFEEFEGRSFSVVGDRILRAGQKDNFCDLDRVLTHFGLNELPKFNGGVYYFNSDPTARSVFKTARKILSKFKELAFAEFRGDGPADEPIVAVAMSLHHQTMLPNYDVMLAPLGRKGKLEVNVIEGKCTFRNADNSKVFNPAIAHFAGIWSEHPTYHREMSSLKNPTSSQQSQVHPLVYKLQYLFGIGKYLFWRMTHHIKAFSRGLLSNEG